MDVLAPDVVSVADGGGKVQGAARRPIVGADRLARYLLGGLAKARGALVAIATLGQRRTRHPDGDRRAVLGGPQRRRRDGRITRIFSIANPDKLGRLDEEAVVSR